MPPGFFMQRKRYLKSAPRRSNAAGRAFALNEISDYISVVRTFFSLAKRGREFSWGTFSSP